MSTRGSKRVLTKEDISRGLSALDDAFEGSELLMSVAPIRFVTLGGMLAVSLFGNRTATKDIDVLLDPNVDAVQDYRDEVFNIIRGVAEKNGFNDDWMNDDLRIFIQSKIRLNLFLESVNQDMIVFAGKNLTLYAGRLDFALERKLRRIDEKNANRVRQVDLSDAVALIHRIKDGGHPLSWEYVQGLDENKLGMIVGNSGIHAANTEYKKVHGSQGIVEMVQDESDGSWKYLNLEDEWVKV